MPRKKGIFISFEGGEGAGKTTQIRLLSRWLMSLGYKVILTKEPGGSTVGKTIRNLLLNPKIQTMSPRTELLLYEADRAQHVDEVIRPALNAGKLVLCDRFDDSSTIYQGICRKQGVSRVRELNHFATASLIPDAVIILDVPERVGLRRAIHRRRLDRLEKEKQAFHQLVRKGFLDLARKDPHRYRVIDATQSEREVFEAIRASVKPLLGKHGVR